MSLDTPGGRRQREAQCVPRGCSSGLLSWPQFCWGAALGWAVMPRGWRLQGKAAALSGVWQDGQEGLSWDPCKPGHRGMRGTGTSTRDTTTPRARNKKTLPVEEVGSVEVIQVARRQGGIRVGRQSRTEWREDTKK